MRPANGATATELDQDEAPGRLHAKIHPAPLEIHSATFRPTDKEKRIHDDGRDAETSAVVRGSTEGFAHVDVVDECGGAELRQGAVGPRGGAGVVSTAAVGCGAPRPADPAGRGAGCQGGADGLWRWMRLLGSLGVGLWRLRG